MLGWKKHKLESRFPGEISMISGVQMTPPLWQKAKEQRREKKLLKTQHSKNYDHGIQSYHFIANIWGNSGNSDRLYFWGGSTITADNDCSNEVKRRLLLGRKAMTKLDSILKSRDITLPTMVHISKAMVFFQ